MREKKEKHFVYTVISKSEQGFTLLSMLAMLTILFTVLPLLAYITKSVTYDSLYDEASIQQFYQFLRDEMLLATDYSVGKNKLTLDTSDRKKISFTRYKQQILRQVDRQGHDIYLRDIEEIVFKELPYGIQVEIISLEGKQYEKTIVFYMGAETKNN